MKILVLNCGSSSLKYQVIDMEDESLICKGVIERIGMEIKEGDGNVQYKPNGEVYIFDKEIKDHGDAIAEVKWLISESEHKVIDSFSEIDAIGHRIGHGGEKYTKSVLATPEVLADVKELSPLAPLHLPANILGYEVCLKLVGSSVPQVFVFDTAFHSTMPPMAYMYAIPYEYFEKFGIRRYGFHGTSHRYISQRCADFMHEDLSKLKMITCHLGNGASIAAIKFGKVFDTSMGFTPLDGVIMGTRSGAIDASAVTYLAKKMNLSPDEMSSYLNKQCGFLGVSDVSSDNREIYAAINNGDEKAQLTADMLRYEIKKYIGSYAAVMNGLDAVIFTGGIGENSWEVRGGVCTNMDYLGIKIDFDLNKTVRGTLTKISTPDSKVEVWVIPTNEELLIARDTLAIISK